MVEGSLRNVPLGDVFGIVANGQKTGVLTVRTADVRARVHFETGRVLLAHARPGVHLAELLVRSDHLTIKEALELLEAGFEGEARFGAAAVGAEWVDAEALHDAIARQSVETLATLLAASDGHFDFQERGPDASQVPMERSQDAMSLLMEAAALQGGVEASPADPDTFFETVGDPTARALPAGAWELLEQTDGRRSARAVVADTELPEAKGLKLLGQLEVDGVLARLPAGMPDPPVLVLTGAFARGRLLRLVLHRSGARAVLAAPGEADAEEAVALRPKFLVIDDDGGAGWGALRRLRRQRGLTHVPAVVLEGTTRRSWWRGRPRHAQVLRRPFEEAALQRLAVRLAGHTLG